MAEVDLESAPRMSFTLRKDGRLDIKNLDRLDLTVDQTVIFRLVRETPAPEGGARHEGGTTFPPPGCIGSPWTR